MVSLGHSELNGVLEFLYFYWVNCGAGVFFVVKISYFQQIADKILSMVKLGTGN